MGAFGFDRVPIAWRPVIEEARAHLPPAVAEVPVRFLCGADPVYVGHQERWAIEYKGVSYTNGETCHAVFRRDDTPTVVLPYVPTPGYIVHEIGHVFDYLRPGTDVPVTTEYSDHVWDNRILNERLPEALQLWYEAHRHRWGYWLDRLMAEEFRPFREATGAT